MTALDRAFAFAEVNDIAVFVGENLNLDVPGPFNVSFDIDGTILKRIESFGLG